MGNIDVRSIGRVGLIELNNPHSLNALTQQLLQEVIDACQKFDDSGDVGCILISSSARHFCAGGDIKEMSSYSTTEAYLQDIFDASQKFSHIRTPMIAAVNGAALGGGCELAMACDIIVAEPDSQFGLPEVHLGIMPGMGGTQRLLRAVGKAKAMEMCLTGEPISGREALELGLVSRLVDLDELATEAFRLAEKIAGNPLVSTRAIKESINAGAEAPLQVGLQIERRLFHSLLATSDRQEGMAAFIEKRSPHFSNH